MFVLFLKKETPLNLKFWIETPLIWNLHRLRGVWVILLLKRAGQLLRMIRLHHQLSAPHFVVWFCGIAKCSDKSYCIDTCFMSKKTTLFLCIHLTQSPKAGRSCDRKKERTNWLLDGRGKTGSWSEDLSSLQLYSLYNESWMKKIRIHDWNEE